MRRTLFAASGAAALVATLSGQTVTRTAVAATDVVVETIGLAGITLTIPLGTQLLDRQSIMAGLGGVASILIGLPPNSGLTRLTCQATSFGNAQAAFRGSTLISLSAPGPTAVDLSLTRTVGGALTGYLQSSVDVGDNGSLELPNGGNVFVTVPAVLGPAPLPIRTTMSGLGFNALGSSLMLEVEIARSLTATSTTYLAGCGATIACAPTNTATLRTSLRNLPANGPAVLVVGIGQTSVALPFGNCLLGVTPDLVLHAQIDASGNGAVDIGVSFGVTTFTANLQAVGLDTATPAVTTSDALAVTIVR